MAISGLPMWPRRIGITISEGVVSCGQHGTDCVHTVRVGQRGIAAALDEAVRNLPRSRGRAFATVALGGEWSQVRRVSGLPRIRDDAALRAVIENAASRFFLRNASGIRTTSVAWTGSSGGFSAAFDGVMIDLLCTSLGNAGIRLVAVLPLLKLASADPRDVAQQSSNQPLAYRPVSSSRMGGWKRWTSVASLLLSAVLALMSPAIAAVTAEAKAQRDISTLSQRWRIDSALSQAVQLQRQLVTVTRFAASARSNVVLVADLTDAIPVGAWISSARTDSSGGVLAVVGDDAEELLSCISRLTSISHVDLIGDVTRVKVRGRLKERMSVRFLWADRR